MWLFIFSWFFFFVIPRSNRSEPMVLENLGRRWLNLTDIKISRAFFKWPKNGGQLAGPFFSRVVWSNFEIRIWFRIVERSNRYAFENEKPPPSAPEKGLQLMKFAHCLHVIAYLLLENIKIFSMRREFLWRIFYRENLVIGRGGSFWWWPFHENFTRGYYLVLIYENCFIYLIF